VKILLSDICYKKGLFSNSLAYQHFSFVLSLFAKNQLCLPTFPINFSIVYWNPTSLTLIWWDSVVPTNISLESHNFLLKTRCAYQHFPWLLSLSAEIQVSLPIFFCVLYHWFSVDQVCLTRFQFVPSQCVPTLGFQKWVI